MQTKKNKNKIVEFFTKNRVSKSEKDSILQNLVDMIATKIDILVALKILKTETKSKGSKELIDNFENDIQSGYPIWKAIKRAELLKPTYLSIIKIGEESGSLPENSQIVINQIKKDAELKSRVISAIIYPVFIFVVMIVIAVAISIFVLPRLSVVYKSLNADLPLITKILIGIGEFLQDYGYIAIPAILTVFALLSFIVFIYKKTNWMGQFLLMKAPVIKKLIVEVEISRMGTLLGTLVKLNFPILDSLTLLEESTVFYQYKRLYKFLRSEIESGSTFQQAFEKYKNVQKLIPFYARQLIVSSQKTGNLPNALQEVGDIYEKKNIATTKDLSVLLEPVLLVIIWLGVAFIALSIILPIYSLIGNITDLSSQRNTVIESSIEKVEEELSPVSSPQVFEIEKENLTGYVSTNNIESNRIPAYQQIGTEITRYLSSNITLEYIDYRDGWYMVVLPRNNNVWVNEEYVTKIQ